MQQNTKRIVFTALFAALTAVTTMFVVIPVPQTNGFINIGDAMIFICAFCLGAVPACIAGGLGSMLADILLGYAHWAPFTLVIKAVEGLVVGIICTVAFKKTKLNMHSIITAIIAMIVGSAVMVTGYFFGGWILESSYASWLSMPSNLIQAGVSSAIALPIYITLEKTGSIRYIKHQFLSQKKHAAIEQEQKPDNDAMSKLN